MVYSKFWLANIKAKGKTQNLSVEEKRKRLNNFTNTISNIYRRRRKQSCPQSCLQISVTSKHCFLKLPAVVFENLNTQSYSWYLTIKHSHQILGVQFGIFQNSVSDEIKDTVNHSQQHFENALTYISTPNF